MVRRGWAAGGWGLWEEEGAIAAENSGGDARSRGGRFCLGVICTR